MTVGLLIKLLERVPPEYEVCRPHREVGSTTAWDDCWGLYIWDPKPEDGWPGIVEFTYQGDPIHGHARKERIDDNGNPD